MTPIYISRATIRKRRESVTKKQPVLDGREEQIARCFNKNARAIDGRGKELRKMKRTERGGVT